MADPIHLAARRCLVARCGGAVGVGRDGHRGRQGRCGARQRHSGRQWSAGLPLLRGRFELLARAGGSTLRCADADGGGVDDSVAIDGDRLDLPQRGIVQNGGAAGGTNAIEEAVAIRAGEQATLPIEGEGNDVRIVAVEEHLGLAPSGDLVDHSVLAGRGVQLPVAVHLESPDVSIVRFVEDLPLPFTGDFQDAAVGGGGGVQHVRRTNRHGVDRQVSARIVERAGGGAGHAVDMSSGAATKVEGALAVDRLRPEERLRRLDQRGHLQGSERRREDHLAIGQDGDTLGRAEFEPLGGLDRPQDRGHRQGRRGPGEQDQDQEPAHGRSERVQRHVIPPLRERAV